MLEDSEFTNRVLRAELLKKFPNKVDNRHGLDVNKIKSINNFPIYKETDGFRSNARPNVDGFMFTSRQSKYDVLAPMHTSVSQIRPNLCNKQKQGVSRYAESSVRMQPGAMASLYGMPPDSDIILENPAAQAMNLMGGQMTEEKLRNHIYRKEENSESEIPGDFFTDPRVKAFMDNSTPMEESTEPEPESVKKIPRQDEIVVQPAFRPTVSNRDEDADAGFNAEISKMNHILDKLRVTPNDKYTTFRKEISDIFVKLNFDKPDGKSN